MNLGDKVRTLRKNKKLTQRDLAKLINKSEISVRKYESSGNIPLDVIMDISSALDVDVKNLIINSTNTDPMDQLQNYLLLKGIAIDKELLEKIEDNILDYVKFKIHENNN